MASLAYCPTCGHKHILEVPPDPARGLRCVQCGAMVRKPRAAEVPAARFVFSPAVGEEPPFPAPSPAPESQPTPSRKPERHPRVEEPLPEPPPAPQGIDEGVSPHQVERENPVDHAMHSEPAPVEEPALAPAEEDQQMPAPVSQKSSFDVLREEERIQAEKLRKPPTSPAVDEEEEKETTLPLMESEEDEEPPARRRDRSKKKQSSDRSRRRWVPWAVGLGLLAALGGGLSYYLSRGKGPAKMAARTGGPQGARKDPIVQPPPPGRAPTAKPKPTPTPATLPPTAPAVKPVDGKVTRLAAARLAAEYVADPAVTNRKYEGATLQVSGRYWKTEKVRVARAPARPHVLFATAGRAVCCDLEASPTDAKLWKALKPGMPFTVRGVYGKDCFLHECLLMTSTPPADKTFKEREIVVTGYADEVLLAGGGRPYPIIKLEHETDSSLDVECVFRELDQGMVAEVQAGSRVTVRGTCSGRVAGGDGFAVRIINCAVVPASPGGKVISAQELARAYEEDLRHELPPGPDDSELTALSLSVTDLGKVFGKDRDSLNNLRNRTLIVTGRAKSRDGKGHTITLRGEDVDQVLTVECRFTRRQYEDLDAGPVYVVQGRCSGLAGASTLRLENCESVDPTGMKDRRRLTADFLPHTPGQTLTYDLATFPPGGKPAVVRQVHRQEERGLVRTYTNAVGTLSVPSLFDTREQGKWVKAPKARKIGGAAGPVYYRRIARGYVEIGQYPPGKAEPSLVWQPVLKLRARVGDSWAWEHDGAEHRYTLERFDDLDGRTAAVIREVMTRKKEETTFESMHVYIQGVGEVERREWQNLALRTKVPIMEKKLVPESAGAARGGKPRTR